MVCVETIPHTVQSVDEFLLCNFTFKVLLSKSSHCEASNGLSREIKVFSHRLLCL